MAGMKRIMVDGEYRQITPLSTAPIFSSGTSYAVGDFCYYDGTLYKCTTAHSGAWVASHFTAVTIGAEIKTAKAELTQLVYTTADNIDRDIYDLGQTLSGDIADVKSDLTEETTARTTADTALQTAVDTLETTLEEDYAKIDGYYEEMAVGSAEQLISTQLTEDKVPYKFRTSGGSIDIGNRETDKIVGGSIAWNQLCAGEARRVTSNGITFSETTDGVWTLNGTSSATAQVTLFLSKCVTGHKYLILGGKSTDIYIVATNASSWQNNKRFDYDGGIIAPCVATAEFSLLLQVASGVTCENIRVTPQFFDLTQMFGSTVADAIYAKEQASAGAGVAWFRKLFPLSYYAYNSGELMHVEGLSSHDMVGFNQWDEEWEVGSYNINTGAKANATDRIRSKNYIPCFPSTRYYFTTETVASALWANVCFYDADKNFISYTGVYSPKSSTSAGFNNPFTTPSNAYYMTFYLNSTYGTTYKNDICINLSWSGTHNGEYEPYKKHSYPLDSSLILRGIPKIDSNGDLYYDGDTYESDGTVTRRFGIVDLGTLNWNYHTASGNMYADNAILNRLVNGGSMCSRYMWASGSSYGGEAQGVSGLTTDKAYTFQSTLTHRIIIRDSSYTTASAFKTAMSGVYIVYELATPTTETAEPYTNPQSVNDWGTEEYVSTSIVPVGHETEYMANLRDKLQHLPDLADSDGYYVIQQAGTQMSLVHFRIPQAPTTDGTYTLKATVSGGVPTYTWESEG